MVDPKIVLQVFADRLTFNYLIMVLYIINAVQWAVRGSIGDACYWLSACAITASVTFLFPH